MQSMNNDIDRADGIRTRVKDMEKIQCLDTVCPPPKSLKIELSSKCNLKCDFCYNKQSERHNFMDFDDYESVIKTASELGIEQVGLLFLGESTLYPKLIDAIKLAKEKYNIPYVFLTTNGLLVKDQLMKDLCNSGLDSLKWSINHCSVEDFLKHTKIDGFYTILNNIRNTHEYVKSNNLSLKLYASSAIYDVNNISNEMKNFVDNKIKPYVNEHYYFEINNQGGLIKNNHFTSSYCNRLPVVPCPRLFNNSYITSDMKVACCCAAFTKDFLLGDLKQESFMDIWNGEKMRILRQAHLSGQIENTVCYEEKN